MLAWVVTPVLQRAYFLHLHGTMFLRNVGVKKTEVGKRKYIFLNLKGRGKLGTSRSANFEWLGATQLPLVCVRVVIGQTDALTAFVIIPHSPPPFSWRPCCTSHDKRSALIIFTLPQTDDIKIVSLVVFSADKT